MAKEAASDVIMPAAKMKPLLALSKKEPVQAAVALTSDGDGLILLDKKANPKKLAAQLKASASKAKLQLNASTVRFGRAEVDPEYDAGTVKFTVNKEAPGNLRIKLIEVVKRAAFQKVEINVDSSLEEEGEEGTAGEAPPAPPPPPEMPGGFDGPALKRELAGLIGQIAAAAGEDGGRRTAMVGFASDANAALKGDDLEAANRAVAQLRDAIEQAKGGGASGNGEAAGRSRSDCIDAYNALVDALDTVDAQLDVLARAMRASGHPGLQQIAEAGLPNIYDGHRHKVIAGCLPMGMAGDGDVAKAAAKALPAITGFAGLLASSPKIAACDDCDLGVAVSIRKTLEPALKQLQDAYSRAAA